MRVRRDGWMLRFFGRGWGEVAYVVAGISGLEASIEFPSDWHEHRRAWVRFGLGIVRIAFSFPWSRVVPDNYQCSGPRYGFKFFSDLLWIYYGKDDGSREGRKYWSCYMPWAWRHIGSAHKVLSEKSEHEYHYCLRNWKVQERVATIHVETRTWWRPWIPWRKTIKSLEVEFNDEVGERSGSWKGGTIGCGYTMRKNETPLECLRRMERERKF